MFFLITNYQHIKKWTTGYSRSDLIKALISTHVIAPMSWDMVRERQGNKSILQFFVRKGTPATDFFGEIENNLGIKGQEVKVSQRSKGEIDRNLINTASNDSQASFSVVQPETTSAQSHYYWRVFPLEKGLYESTRSDQNWHFSTLFNKITC